MVCAKVLIKAKTRNVSAYMDTKDILTFICRTQDNVNMSDKSLKYI